MRDKTCADLLAKALNEIINVQNLNDAETKQYINNNGPIPPNVPLGDGHMVCTTADGLRAIYAFGEQWRLESPERRRIIKKKDVCSLAVGVLGEVLRKRDWVGKNPNDPALAADFKKRLDERLTAIQHDVVHYFPCQIFDDTSVGSFVIGPVRFSSRLEWLNEVETIGRIKPEWVGDVHNAWTNDSEIHQEITPANTEAQIIIQEFGACPWVAAVTIKGNHVGRSKERATTAVRLAIDALALITTPSQAACLRGPGDALHPTHSITLTQLPGRVPMMGYAGNVPGFGGPPNYARTLVTGIESFRQAAGSAISAITATESSGTNHPKLRERWCNALFWFGEARRDAADFMALVHYGMALDILAKGGKARGILRMVSALLSCQPTDPVSKDGPTLEQAIKHIYNECRSQFCHGGRPALLEDLPFSREGAHWITTAALSSYVLSLGHYTGTDDYGAFVQHLEAIKSTC